MQLHNAGGGGELLWTGAGTPRPTASGGPWRWTTKGRWHFGCVASLRSGHAGEGFLGIAPDGTRYRFDWLSHERAPGITRPVLPNGEVLLTRREVRLYPTRVEDRFGNWVEYDWQAERLTAIRASDGRRITLSYVQFSAGSQSWDSGYRISTVSDGSRTWRYFYNATGSSLTRVVQPDGSAWELDFSELLGAWTHYQLEGSPVRSAVHRPCAKARSGTACWPAHGCRALKSVRFAPAV